MTRRFKGFGLALIAACCMVSTMATSAAVAHTPAIFTTEAAPATITGSQATLHQFTVTGQILTCETMTYHGTVNTTQITEITITPTYKECIIAAGALPVTITGFSNGNCWYVFHASGSVDLECKAGTAVTADAGPCVIHFPPQANLGTIAYSTGAGPEGRHDLKLQFEVNLKATHTDGFLCAFTGSGEGNLVWEGESTWIAETEFSSELLHLTHSPTVP